MEKATRLAGIGAEHLDKRQPTPLYHQITLLLRDRIRSGALPPGGTLPGEQEMALIFQVSRVTVARALAGLANDGLVQRHRGRRTVVSARPVIPVIRGSFDTLLHSLRAMGLETEVELLEVCEIEADKTVAEQLELAPGTIVQRAIRRRKLAGEPFSCIVSFVPIEIARRYSIADLASSPLLRLLHHVGAGACSAEQWITAVAADPVIAVALGVDTATALLRIERVMRSDKGVPVQLLHGHYRPDRFQYHLVTRRARGAKSSAGAWAEDP